MIERALLGVMLRSSGVIPTVRERLDLSDYELESSRIIARRMYDFSEQNISSNVVAVISGLTQEDLQRAGGASYVASLPDGIPVVDDAGLNYYCEVVRRKSVDRQIQRINEEIQHDIADGEKPSVALERHLAKLNELQAAFSAAGASAEVEYGCTLAELENSEAANTEWIAFGLIAPGVVTELVGQVKLGKTRWAMALTYVCAFGGDFLGYHVSRCRTVYLTEQSRKVYKAQAREAGILGSPDIHVIFYHEVSHLSWDQIVTYAVKKAAAFGARVLIVDTFSKFAKFEEKGENDQGEADRKMAPLCAAAAVSDLAVVNLRHARKGGGDVADAARGSAAISGNADIILYLQASPGAGKFYRELTSRSRFADETPDKCTIELHGTHYRLVEDTGAIKQDRLTALILACLPVEPAVGMTYQAVAEKLNIKVEAARVALKHLSQTGKINGIGEGKRGDPVLYRNLAPSSTNPQPDLWENSPPPNTAARPVEENAPIPPDFPNDESGETEGDEGFGIPHSPNPIGLGLWENESPSSAVLENSTSDSNSSPQNPKSIDREKGEKREW
jgi:hypothetical protein